MPAASCASLASSGECDDHGIGLTVGEQTGCTRLEAEGRCCGCASEAEGVDRRAGRSVEQEAEAQLERVEDQPLVVETQPESDAARVAAGVVAGIGFIGAGTIISTRGGLLAGLTTAASIWAVAAIGLAAGAGLYIPTTVATVIIVIILMLPKRI